MHTQLFLTAWNPLVTGDHFFAAVILLAVLLFAELVGIGVLTFKLLRVRRAKKMQEHAAQSNELHYAVAPAFLLGAIPQLTSTLLTVLMLSLAAASLLLVVLLIVFRSCGYEFLPRSARKLAKRQREEAAVISAYTEPEQADEPLEYVADAEAAEIELQEQASYAAASVATASIISYDEDETEEETDAFEIEDGAAEESEVEEAEEIEEVIEAEEVVEENVEEVVEEMTAEAEPVAISGEVIPPAPVAQQPAAEPAPTVTVSGEQGPVKVVEKVVTETYKEIIREIPAESSGAEKASTSSERVIEKLTDLLEQALNLQKPAEAATAAAVAESTPVAAAGKQFDDEDDEDDEDDTDLDDATDAEDADDVDDEENDIAEDRFTGNERIIGFDDETGMYIVAHYRKSFEAKLIQARPNIKKYYSELKNALLSYKGSKSRISWTADSFHNGRASIAKINVKTRILEIYLALDPATLEGTVYRGKDVGSKKKYADTPFQYKIRTPRKFKWAMELVQRTCEEHGLTPIDIEPIAYDEQYPFDSTENLVERKLIKEYIRQEKPATTFELAEDHQTAVPDVDDSVIPANANFSWEFDNDMLNDPARDVEEASVAEIEVAEVSVEEEAPVAEAQAETAPEPAEVPAPPAAVYKETVKVTEMRYTERYYGDGQAPVTELAESTRELVSGNDGAEAEDEADAFTTDKFEGADPFEAYRNDDLTSAEAVEAEEVAAEEIEAVEEVEEEIEETEEIEELEEEVEVIEDLEESDEIEDDDQPVWTGLGGEPAEDVEYEEVVEYVEVDDDSAEDVE